VGRVCKGHGLDFELQCVRRGVPGYAGLATKCVLVGGRGGGAVDTAGLAWRCVVQLPQEAHLLELDAVLDVVPEQLVCGDLGSGCVVESEGQGRAARTMPWCAVQVPQPHRTSTGRMCVPVPGWRI
jgi:hypothetical protein